MHRVILLNVRTSTQKEEKNVQQINRRVSSMRKEKTQIKNYVTPKFRIYSNFLWNSATPSSVPNPFPYDWVRLQEDLGNLADSQQRRLAPVYKPHVTSV